MYCCTTITVSENIHIPRIGRVNKHFSSLLAILSANNQSFATLYSRLNRRDMKKMLMTAYIRRTELELRDHR